MTATNYKVENGLQLLARLRRNVCNTIYPVILDTDIKLNGVIEIFGESSSCKSLLATNIVTEALTPTKLCGAETGVLVLSTDGNIDPSIILHSLKEKILTRIKTNLNESRSNEEEINMMIHDSIARLHFAEIFNVTQFYSNILNFENFLSSHPYVSLIVIDTLTAFYWTEQDTKLTKMDQYIKQILKLLKKVTRDYDVTILYTRPQYFNSIKEKKDNSDMGFKSLSTEDINCRMHINKRSNIKEKVYEITIKSSEIQLQKYFQISNFTLLWSQQ